MTPEKILKRKIQLKGQHLELITAEHRELIDKIKGERKSLIYKLALVGLKDTLEGQIKARFDPVLSRKLDCVIYLLEN